MPVTGWKLGPDCRAFLLDIFPPRWPDVIADHVTLDGDATRRDPPPPPSANAAVVGHADDDAGLEALVVAIDGTADRRDGSIFHITWSLDREKGREAKESNDLLAHQGWRRLAAPIVIDLIPSRF